MATRNFGLDMLRTIAITGVVLFHASPILKLPPSICAWTGHGWMGVDLFFVLSGYLIGLQSIVRRAAGSRWDQCTSFWIKRWTRTVPLYAVVLFTYVVLKPSIFHAPFVGGFNWKWLLCLQNYGEIRDFGQSWSLCIEEQFYFVLPIVTLLLNRMPSAAWLIPLVLSTAVRFYTARSLAGDTWGSVTLSTQAYVDIFRLRTVAMLDSISVGVFLAATRESWSSWPASIRMIFGAAGAAVIVAIAMLIRTVPVAPLLIALQYSGIAVGFGAILIAAEQWHAYKGAFASLRFVALWSYSCYLWHELITRLFDRYTRSQSSGARFLEYIFVVLCVSKLSYELIEKPGLKLRERILADGTARNSPS